MLRLLMLFIFWTCVNCNIVGAEVEIESRDLQHQLSHNSQRKKGIVTIAEPLELFIIDLVNTWKLLSPTMISQEEIPSFCRRHEWILCVTYDKNSEGLAEHMARINRGRKQDGTIFVGSQVHDQLITQMVKLEPSYFTSECPVFMPKDDYKFLDLRLDSNVIFYDKVNQTEYELVDIFAVKGGPPIILGLGKWDTDNGISFRLSMNRWKRRTDLKGATFVNGLYYKYPYAYFKKDESGNVVGSAGHYQEKLFYMTDQLNLTIKTVDYKRGAGRKLLKNGTWEGPFGMLQRREIDVDSAGIGINIPRTAIIDFPLATDRYGTTIVVKKQSSTAPNMWVYVQVFGLFQWSIFLGLLTLLVMGFFLANSLTLDDGVMVFATKKGNQAHLKFDSVASSLSLVYLYTIQMGSHLETKQKATRLLTMTTSVLTLLFFVYYTTDITANMTHGPPRIPLRSFEDIIHHGYSVVVSSGYYKSVLASADPESAKGIVLGIFAKSVHGFKCSRT